MSYYGVEPWQNQSRQAPWEHPPSRSGASSSTSGRDEQSSPFQSQMEEVERAIENLARSGKLAPAGPGGTPPYRRDPVMMGGAPASSSGPGGSGGSGSSRHGEFGGAGHHGPPPSRHHSMSEFESRQGNHGHGHGHGSHNSGNVQGFYQNQRYGGGSNGPHGGHFGGRKSEADQMQQAQRRMAAQRERDLRNYHQEQQYNRGKPERTMSPNMSEEERRDLIARQHRALYDNEQSAAAFDGRGPSPMPYQPFGPNVPNPDGAVQTNAGDHTQAGGPSPQAVANNTPPLGVQGSTSMPRTSTSSPKDPLLSQGNSSPNRQHNKTVSAGPSVSVAPIGTRPAAGSISQGKRPTPPTTSPLGIPGSERAPSSASNPGKDNGTGNANSGGNSTWGNSSGVWGKNPLGVQASVWG